jgi:hypothetical protein
MNPGARAPHYEKNPKILFESFSFFFKYMPVYIMLCRFYHKKQPCVTYI